MTAAATVALSLGMNPDSLIAAALNALNRLVTDPSVAHETARRAADSILRYLLQTSPTKEKPAREAATSAAPRVKPSDSPMSSEPASPTPAPVNALASTSPQSAPPTPAPAPAPARDDARQPNTTHAATRTGPPPRK